MHTCCGLSSGLFSLSVLLFVTSDSGPTDVVSFFTRYRMPGVSGREAISCSSRGRSFCRINVVSGAMGLLQPNDIRVFSRLSDASDSSGQFSASSVVGRHLQSLAFPEIVSTITQNCHITCYQTNRIYFTSEELSTAILFFIIIFAQNL